MDELLGSMVGCVRLRAVTKNCGGPPGHNINGKGSTSKELDEQVNNRATASWLML
jgi:hypothetical protein